MVIARRDLTAIRRAFDQLSGPVKIDYFHQSETGLVIPGRRACPTCKEAKATLEQIAALSDAIELRVYEFADEQDVAKKRGVEHVPGIVVRGEVNRPLRLYGMPGGVFLPLLVQTIVDAAGKPPQPPVDVARPLKKLRARAHLHVFGSLAQPPSAEAARTAYGVALVSSKVQVTVYVIEEFAELARRQGVERIPATFVNDRAAFAGVATAATLVGLIRDLQAHPRQVRLAAPPVAPGSSQPWSPPRQETTPGAAQAGAGPGPPQAGGGRRTPGGLIIPER